MDWFLAIKWSQHLLEILHDHEGIIVSLEEPVKLIPVVLVAVLESSLKKGVNLRNFNLINFNLGWLVKKGWHEKTSKFTQLAIIWNEKFH